MHLLARVGAIGPLRALMRSGADVNAVDARDETLLFYGLHAARFGTILSLFVAHGGDVNRLNTACVS